MAIGCCAKCGQDKELTSTCSECGSSLCSDCSSQQSSSDCGSSSKNRMVD